jgi:hypothetical protein
MVVIRVAFIYEWEHNLNDAIALLKLQDIPWISNYICSGVQRYQLIKSLLRNKIMICAEFHQKWIILLLKKATVRTIYCLI